MSSYCCGVREKQAKQSKSLIWKFSNGSKVLSESFEGAVKELNKVDSKNFWASETQNGVWDVQLTDSVVIYDIQAKTVLEAVRIARWKAHLDKTFKKVDDYGTNSNVF